jgi:hypothetical protein
MFSVPLVKPLTSPRLASVWPAVMPLPTASAALEPSKMFSAPRVKVPISSRLANVSPAVIPFPIAMHARSIPSLVTCPAATVLTERS